MPSSTSARRTGRASSDRPLPVRGLAGSITTPAIVLVCRRNVVSAGPQNVRPPLHHLGLPQLRDFVRAKAELGKHLLGLLAEFRRPRRHFAGGARKRDGL